MCANPPLAPALLAAAGAGKGVTVRTNIQVTEDRARLRAEELNGSLYTASFLLLPCGDSLPISVLRSLMTGRGPIQSRRIRGGHCSVGLGGIERNHGLSLNSLNSY